MMILKIRSDSMEKYRIILKRTLSKKLLEETPRFNQFMDCLIECLDEYKDYKITHSSHYDDLSDSLINVVEFEQNVDD